MVMYYIIQLHSYNSFYSILFHLSSYIPFKRMNNLLRNVMEGLNMQIETFSLGPLGTNCYIVSKDDKALIFDPGGDASVVEQYVQKNKLTPLAILLTHAHYDHIGAVDRLRKLYTIDVYLHEEEVDWLENPELNRSSFGMDEIITEAPDKILSPGSFTLGPFEFDVVHTPGHSPGSVSFIFNHAEFTISGDVLFNRGIGRTDLPEGSIDQLVHSISTKLYTLPDTYTVYPGHGPHTIIGEEKRNNPFTLQFYRP